ncbi:MAG: S9 family peptidase [Planctomycetota bacterium]|nr:S9 family peptidase [Planctomycetota bacterium]
MHPVVSTTSLIALVGMTSFALGNQAASPSTTPLIPRDTLFGNPERAGLQISPDGTTISYLAPHEDVLNVWIRPTAGGEASVVTSSTDRPIMGYAWAVNGEQILYSLDKNGDENTHVYAVDLQTKETTDLTPFDGVKAGIAGQHKDRPDDILIQMNQRDPRNMDMYKVNTRTGESEMIFANDDGYVGMMPDDDWTIRGRARMTEDGGTLFELRNSADGEWYEFLNVPMQDSMNTMPLGFSKDGTIMYAKDATGRDTSALVSMPARKGGAEQATIIFESDKADVGGIYSDMDTHEPRAVSVNYLRNEWHVLDPELQVHIDAIKALDAGDPAITDWTLDESTMVVAFERDNGPVNYWLYDTETRTGTYLFSNRPDLEQYELVKTRPVEIIARDGLVLPSYVTTPKGEGPWPTVVLVHGGPWARDSWGYNPIHQWLANRGYAVLSPNFRGSTGFGKEFLNAGNRQWYHAMQDDVNDAAAWAIEEGIADKDKLAIMGGSYGGYATLAGMTRDPELWTCGVDIVGPSHIGTLLSTIPMYWEPIKIMFTERVGGVDETEWLDSISPLTHVSNIQKPLLIGQGANDPRVKVAESDQIVSAMNERSIPVTYVVFPDEGHGFAKPENRLAFMAVTEQFLSEHLGGRAEAVGSEVEASTAQVRDLGSLQVEGVALWEPSEAPADVPAATPGAAVSLADLTPEQQAQVQQFLQQVDTIPLDQLGMMKSLLEAQRTNVPPAELPLFEFMLQTINEKIAEKS